MHSGELVARQHQLKPGIIRSDLEHRDRKVPLEILQLFNFLSSFDLLHFPPLLLHFLPVFFQLRFFLPLLVILLLPSIFFILDFLPLHLQFFVLFSPFLRVLVIRLDPVQLHVVEEHVLFFFLALFHPHFRIIQCLFFSQHFQFPSYIF